jgi:hypothetical protein
MRVALLLVVAAVTVADARPARRPATNMPRGWTWPPSRTMLEASKACETKLDELDVVWKPAKGEGHVVDPIALADATIGGISYTDAYGERVAVMDCQLALALAKFAPRLYELGVRDVKFGSIYRWSKVRVGGKTKDALSRHALGLAIDVVSFVDDNGREVVVAKDYKNDDELLLGVERSINDSGLFRVVLTPRNDPISHKDHFHVEANPDYDTNVDARPAS